MRCKGRSTVNLEMLLILLAAISFSITALADAGKDAYNRGVTAMSRHDFDTAYGYFKQAYTLSPNNPKYYAEYTQARFNAAVQHVHKGQLLSSTGALKEALVEFQRAADIDTSSYVAQQELRRTTDAIKKKEKQLQSPKSEPPKITFPDDLSEPVDLRPLSNAPITLRMTADADVAYRTIGKLAGLNVLTDPDYRPQKVTVELNDVTLRQALDMLSLQSKTFWHPVLSNTIMIASESPAKRKEYEQNVMKTFYLRNITSPNDLTEAGNMVRQILDVARVQLLPSQDALILRGTPDQMLLAEKLLADYDKPKSEVVIEVAVMQVSRDRIRTLGTTVPTSFNVGVSPPSSSSGSSSGGGSGNGAFTLRTLQALTQDNFMVSIPGGSFSVLASDSNTKILQRPEIRTLNNEKATLRIGDRVPIATGSFQPGIAGGAGVSPLVNTQFQYLDVGVNIDITPHIHSDNEVTLKMALEISSVTGTNNIGGITQPVIGQRRIEHETRLVDGEVNLLGGILEESEAQSLSGFPLISKLPILKYLFAQENKDHRENEIIFAITPHIVRARELNDMNLRAIEVGTGSSIELRRKPVSPAPSVAEHPTDRPSAPQANPQPSTPPTSTPPMTAPASARPTAALPNNHQRESIVSR